MVPSIRERERDWGGEQGKQGVKKKIGIRSGTRKAESKVGGVEQGEKHHPWGVYPPALHSFCHFSSTAIFCSKKTGREVIPEHSPTNQPGFEPSVLLSKPISTAKATCQSLSNCPSFHPMAWICQVSKDQWDIPPTPHSRKEVEQVCKADTLSTCPGGR